MTQGTDYTMQFTAAGSEPLSWSLEPMAVGTAVPAEASIDNTGKLAIKGSIAVGTYNFTVKVSNDAGSDTFQFSVTVQADRRFILPDIIR